MYHIYLYNEQLNAWIMKFYFYPLEANKMLCRKVIRILYTDFRIVIIFLMPLTKDVLRCY